MRNVVIFLCIFFLNNTFASNLNITIDHHGIIDSLKSDNSKSIPYKTLPNLKQKDFIFQTERLKKHYEKVIRLIPNNSFLILLGNENNIITGVDKNFVPTPISFAICITEGVVSIIGGGVFSLENEFEMIRKRIDEFIIFIKKSN